MSNTNPSAENSRAVYEPLGRYIPYTVFLPIHPQYFSGMQSSSVTAMGHLWEQALAGTLKSDLSMISRQISSGGTNFGYGNESMQRNLALIRLLRSWREGNEQEQQDTWEYLKRALDEDRTSDRKLFP
jgi:hypothetical protein